LSQLRDIRNKREASPLLHDKDLQAFRELSHPGGTIARTRVSTSKAKVELDSKFESQLALLINEERKSFGSLQGELLRIKLHGRKTFSIYPLVGPTSIYCEFDPALKDLAKQALEKHVRIRGYKYYRPEAAFPHKVRVMDMEIIDDSRENHLRTLKGVAPNATGDQSSEEFVKRLREEWDDGR
jgi:hypothetical protein